MLLGAWERLLSSQDFFSFEPLLTVVFYKVLLMVLFCTYYNLEWTSTIIRTQEVRRKGYWSHLGVCFLHINNCTLYWWDIWDVKIFLLFHYLASFFFLSENSYYISPGAQDFAPLLFRTGRLYGTSVEGGRLRCHLHRVLDEPLAQGWHSHLLLLQSMVVK